MAGRELFVGLDVGGTSVKVGAFSREGELLGKTSVPTPPLVDAAGYAAVCEGIAKLAGEMNADPADVRGIGLAVPCPIPEDGQIKVQANISLDLTGLAGALRACYPAAFVAFDNDANAATMGELWQGSGRGESSLVMVTLGTGVGGGVVIDGRVVKGANGAGGEIGHMCVNPNEPRACGCGCHGCLEQYASAKGIVRSYLAACEANGEEPRELGGETDTLTVFKAAEAGDEAARTAISTMCDYLGRALSMIANVVDPRRFVLGGGVSGGFALFGDELVERYRHYAIASNEDTPIVVAELGNDAGVYGAAYEGLLASDAR